MNSRAPELGSVPFSLLAQENRDAQAYFSLNHAEPVRIRSPTSQKRSDRLPSAKQTDLLNGR